MEGFHFCLDPLLFGQRADFVDHVKDLANSMELGPTPDHVSQRLEDECLGVFALEEEGDSPPGVGKARGELWEVEEERKEAARGEVHDNVWGKEEPGGRSRGRG